MGTRAQTRMPGLRAKGLLMHLRGNARDVEEVLDVADALDLADLRLEVVDHVLGRNLAAQLDEPLLDVDVDLPLGDVRRPEDLRLDLVGQRRVVHLLRLPPVLRAPEDRRRSPAQLLTP